MRRFEEVLSLISSILLGILVTDFDRLTCSLSKYMQHTALAAECNAVDDPVAAATAVMIIALLLRNIHGAVRYDSWCQHHSFKPRFEFHVAGRIWTFLLALAGLFLGPSFVGHIFTGHLSPGFSEFWFAGLLFLTLMVYFAWDVTLWFSTDPQALDAASLEMEAIALRWLKADAVAFLFMGLLLLADFISRTRGPSVVTPSIISLVFVGVSGLVIALDYYLNRTFYFPERA